MYDDFDDYLNDVLDTFFSAEDGTELVLEGIDNDDELYIDELNDVEPTDAELDAIESEIGKASVQEI